VARAADTYVPFEGEKTTWHEGFDRYDYLMDEASFAINAFKALDTEQFCGRQSTPKGERRCIVVAPKQAAPGNPWSWQGCYWTRAANGSRIAPARFSHRLHHARPPGKQMGRVYDWLTEKHGLSRNRPSSA